MAPLLVQVRSASVQASSPSAQVKAAAAQAGDRNWNWRKKILCPTMEVLHELYGPRMLGSTLEHLSCGFSLTVEWGI